MKPIFYIVLLYACLAASCSKLLNEDMRSAIPDNYLNTPEGFNAGVNSAYSYLRTWYGNQMGAQLTVYGTDTYMCGGGELALDAYNFNLTPGRGFISAPWNDLNLAVNACNAVISRAPQVPLAEGQKNIRIGEVRFLRAMYWFLLMQTWGPVNLATTETTAVTTSAHRTPVDSIYRAIIDDLNFSVANLPATVTAYGRVTKPAAEHFLAKVYLTRAGSTAKQADDYKQAATLAKAVISQYSYQLPGNFADVFAQGAGEKNPEVVFAVQYSKNILTNGIGNQAHLFYGMNYTALPGMVRDLANGRTYSYFRPTRFTTDTLFDKVHDSRYDKSFVTVYYCNKPGTYTINGRAVTLQSGDTAIYLPGHEVTAAERNRANYTIIAPSQYNNSYFPTLTKFLDPQRPDVNNENGSRDFLVFRLAETYLIAAEALLMSGQPAEAVPYVNAVRKRAAKTGDTPAETAANQAAMEITAADLNIDFILDERGRELLGEYTRWFDLVRTGKLLERVKLHNPNASRNIKSFHVLRPIPQDQIDKTAGGAAAFPQNAGY
ncbi:Starch-binding associating with outer membrane [Chitinophaga eiseniae]|uniref:Starch-binding associating with outer membrane n=1 Tax=Chitinophaga eiseniae TaxID=634771 RepID=A0A1T4TMC0_9BACT|nr:RagB/SusD family nutrient uptake outer membrane protein [Chitinophaga eiseniae]SKA41625.1 Starch-binding associating with outer membrane [Chitinophaga eiseniae]